jgi:hypothetical protein
MIEYVTYPRDIGQWDQGEDLLFYLEVFGDATPRISHGYVESPLPEGDGFKRATSLAPVYEYYWSIGYIDLDGKCGPDNWGGEPGDTAAEVYLYFPTVGGWQVEELIATIKYLCPAKEHSSIIQSAAHMFAAAQPIVEDASKLAAAGSVVPGAGPIAASTATLLDVIARLKVTSIPPADGYEWSVQKASHHVHDEGLLHGIKWTIPKKLFFEFGSRLTGSIAVNVIPSARQACSGERVPDGIRRLPVRARAIMYLHPRHAEKNGPATLPEGNGKFLELWIEPTDGGQ